ncbi:MAG: hypothetical protein WBB68_01780 [Candidatus Moraniibacteriota bacterium]
MSLKILLLPVFVILDVILVIGYIKPDASDIFAKRDEIVATEAELAKVDAVSGNIQALGQALASRDEAVSFVDRYYPRALDEERVVDMFNFLAQQSGLIVTGVKITKNQATHPTDEAYNEAINSGMTPEQATVYAETAALALPQGYTAAVAVLGAYPNIKDFFNRIHHADRLHETAEFAITQRERDAGQTEEEITRGIQENFLIGTFEANFPYVGAQQASDPLVDPIFQSSAVDFETAEHALTFVTSPLPLLDSGTSGRPNPFE